MWESAERMRHRHFLSCGQSLYEFFCQLLLRDLENFPEKGKLPEEIAITDSVLELRDYILFWRRQELEMLRTYSSRRLCLLSSDALRVLFRIFTAQEPIWVYAGIAKRCMEILKTRR